MGTSANETEETSALGFWRPETFSIVVTDELRKIGMVMEDPGYREKDSWFTRLFLRPNPSIARYIYAFIFLITSLLAWTIRDYGHAVLSELRRLKGCHGARYCLGTEGVLRISFGCSMFFFVLFFTTVGTKKVKDARNSWHSEWWLAKMLMWVSFMVVPFFIPSKFFMIYGKVAHVGAGAFLVIQLISVISFINWLNDCCHSEKYAERCHIQVMIITMAAYVASIVGCIMMYVWYAPELSCWLNILFISLTLLLLQIMTFISVHPKVRAGYLAPGLMGAYTVFLCWSGIRSEPQTEICNQKAEVGNGSDWLTIVSFVIAILVIVVATFSTGIDSKCFQFKKIERSSDDDVPYGYGFFHFVFAIGSMYFGMLFIGWDVHKNMQKWTIDVGWASTWVRVVNEWLAAIIFVWMMLAPQVWKGRSETT
ncbi:probable serine incorporator isoform X1 [Dendrobium catenatum]|nr:probable serine incorporator isoform X1 [Dendrobium catenatum]XP_028556229.1 probable serine incorporator isoform X1 [Dendrobium catenatum]